MKYTWSTCWFGIHNRHTHRHTCNYGNMLSCVLHNICHTFRHADSCLVQRKCTEQTARQRQIIDLLDNEAGLTEQERKLLHVLATAEKNDLQAQESERKQAVQKRIEGKKQRRERNHRLFLAAGLLIEAGLVDTKTGELCYKKDRILQALKELKYDLETSPNPDA